MPLIPSLLQAIVHLDGDTLVLQVGEPPYIVAPTRHVALGTQGLPRDVVEEFLTRLLPKAARATLAESGAIYHELPHLPAFGDAQFTVVVTRGDDLRVEIRRNRSAGLDVPTPAPQERPARPRHQRADGHHPSSPIRRFPERVLFIEDSLDQLDLYEIALNERYEFLGASDGETGLTIAATTLPDVVLVDLGLPGVSGWEVCRHLKTDAHTATIPIIILTAQDGPDLRDEARRVGATELLRKPCAADTLRDRIAAAIQRDDTHA